MIKFITLFAEDLEKTADVYRALGLIFAGERHGDGPYHLAHENDGFVIEIYSRTQTRCDGVMLGFEVRELANAKSEILETSATLVKDIAVIDGARRMIVADPEGRQIYIQEGKSRNGN